MDKQTILYGFSPELIEKYIKRNKKKKIAFIIDSNKKFNNSSYNNIKIFFKDKLDKINKKNYKIIITSSLFEGIMAILKKKKFIFKKHFFLSDDLKDYFETSKLHSIDKNIIFSSPDFPDSNSYFKKSKLAGGLYTYSLKEKKLNKIYTGHCRQIISQKNGFCTVDCVKNLIIFVNKKMKVISKFSLNNFFKNHKNIKLIGLAKNINDIYIADSENDRIFSINLIQNKLNKVFNINLNVKDKKINTSHHINDLFFSKKKLLVSFFSKSGEWKSKLKKDGGVISINLDNNKKKYLYKNIWHPHSVCLLQNKTYLLNSMEGKLLENKKVIFKTNGFIRGLDRDKDLFLIGQSSNYYSSLISKISKNTSINTGFYLFNKKSKISKFFEIEGISNIHDIKFIN